MNTCYPSLRGKFGTTKYFLTTMPVDDLVRRVQFIEDRPEWERLSPEAKYQRKLNLARIKRDLVPYFEQDPDRFSNSLVMAFSNKDLKFECLSELSGSINLPNLYKDPATELGFVTMTENVALIPLDGQHRAKAFHEILVTSSDRPSYEERSELDLGCDDVAVMLVGFDPTTARRIFNKINRYARPTGKAANLITDDDDSIAVITRELIKQDVIPRRLVNMDNNTLNTKAHEFTTLATLYEANKKLVTALEVPTTTKPTRMDNPERDDRLQELGKEWTRLLAGIGPWQKATRDPTERGDETRVSLRKKSVLGKPIGQTALINGYALACMKDRERIDRDDLVTKLNMINWSMSASDWKGLLVKSNGRIMAGRPASNNAGIVIAHLIGAKLTDQERSGALRFIHGNAARKKLPPRVRA